MHITYFECVLGFFIGTIETVTILQVLSVFQLLTDSANRYFERYKPKHLVTYQNFGTQNPK
jgi:hypothetical protein